MSTLSGGSHNITAVYSGDYFFGGSSGSTTEMVDTLTPDVTLEADGTAAMTGDPLSFTAVVTGPAPNLPTPTGSVNIYDNGTLIGSANLVTNGADAVASFEAPTLGAGTHVITASYSGDTNYAFGSGAADYALANGGASEVIESVGSLSEVNTTTTLATSANPSYAGQSVTFTATVAPAATGGALPTGAVTFYDGKTVLGTGTLTNVSGVATATFITSQLLPGSHKVTAVYAGNTVYNGSNSSVVQKLNSAQTSLALTESLSTFTLGQTNTISATLTSTMPIGGPAPTGTIGLYNGTTLLGSVTLNSTMGGKVSFTVPDLPAGVHNLTVTYSGDGQSATSSASIQETVNMATPTMTLASAASSFPSARPLALTATITRQSTGSFGPSAIGPTGTVTFYDGSTAIGTATPSWFSGDMYHAVLNISTLSIGNHSITAVYSGDSNFYSVTTAALGQTITNGATTTTLTSSLSPMIVGQTTTLTAKVTQAAGSTAPSGWVYFYSDGTYIGGAALNGASGNDLAALNVATLSAGSHAITAVYQSDQNYNSSTSAAVTQTVNVATTTATLSSTASSFPSARALALTATITGQFAGNIGPSGTVTFYDGSTAIGSASASWYSGNMSRAVLNVSTLSVGSHSITAVYSGDSNFSSATAAALSQSITNSASTTTLTSSLNPTIFGQTTTLTAKVAQAAGSAAPTGWVYFYNGSVYLGGTMLNGVNGNDLATLNVATLSAGSHALTAVYQSDQNYNSSTSTAVSQTVNVATPTVTLSSTSSLFPAARPLALTATITPPYTGGVAPTGTITFYDGSTAIGTASPSWFSANKYRAVLNVSTLSIGSHSITAVYGGDISFSSVTTAALAQTITNGATTTTLTSSLNPTIYGQTTTLTAKVTQAVDSSAPMGTVSFYDGSTYLGNGTLNSVNGNDLATLNVAMLSAGSRLITAVYQSDQNYNSSTSAALAQTVNVATPTVMLFSTANPSPSGRSLALTATITPQFTGSGQSGVGTSGTVTFYDGSTPIGTASPFLYSGYVYHAVLNISTLSIGNHSITALYSGNANFGSAATATALVETITNGVTTTTLTSSLNPTLFGQTTVFTATVTQAVGSSAPTGSVYFYNGSAYLGSGTLSGVAGNDQATLNVSTLSVGSHSLTAVYQSDQNFSSSTSVALSQTVNVAAPTVTLSSVANPSPSGRSLALTATITAQLAGGGALPSGTVTFYDGSTAIGTASAYGYLGNTSQAVLNVSTLSIGNHNITAVYGGDTNFSPATTAAALVETITNSATTTTLTSSLSPTLYEQTTILTATVTQAAGSAAPTGWVYFYNGGAYLGGAILNGVSGNDQATLNVSTLSVGSHSITAVYESDQNFNSSTSAAVSQTVNIATPTVSLSSAANPFPSGRSLALTALITSQLAGGATGPSGTVTFYDGSTAIGSAPATWYFGNTSQAVLNISTLSIGNHSITASYSGDSNFSSATTSAPLVETIANGATTTTLTSSLNPTLFGQTTTLTATVIQAVGSTAPTGWVYFYDGTSYLGLSSLNGLSGNDQATLGVSTLSVGSHSLTAVYQSDQNYSGSTSVVISQTVNVATPTVTLSSPASSFPSGRALALTATITPPLTGGAAPSGTVTFYDGSTAIGTASAYWYGGATSQAVLNVSTLGIGSHSITAAYSGDANFTSASTSALTQTITNGATITALSSSTNPSLYGQATSLTATVTQAVGSTAPSGWVNFYSDGSYLGGATFNGVSGNDQATLNVGALSTGSHSLTAVYQSDQSYNSSTSAAVSQTVNVATPTVTMSSAASSFPSARQLALTATITAPFTGGTGPSGTVTFYEGSTTLGTSSAYWYSGNTSQAVLSISTLSIGSHSITAVYSGDTSFSSATSAALAQTIVNGSTTTTVTSSLNPTQYGQTTTFTATVTQAAGSTAPTGAVYFYDAGYYLGNGTLNGVAGNDQATLNVATLSAGSHSITAVYQSDQNYDGSSSTAASQTVNAAAPTVTLSSTANPFPSARSLALTATITPQFTGGGTGPTGVVTFYDGSTAVGTASPFWYSGSTYHAVLNISTLSIGNHSITAVYSGDINYSTATTAALNQTINNSATTTTLASSLNPTIAGQTTTLTATVTQAAGSTAPTGTVYFYDGSSYLGSGTLNGVSGNDQATLNVSTLSAGSHSITALYQSDQNYISSTSAAVSQTVNLDLPTVTLSSAANPFPSARSLGLTATLTPQFTGGGWAKWHRHLLRRFHGNWHRVALLVFRVHIPCRAQHLDVECGKPQHHGGL